MLKRQHRIYLQRLIEPRRQSTPNASWRLFSVWSRTRWRGVGMDHARALLPHGVVPAPRFRCALERAVSVRRLRAGHADVACDNRRRPHCSLRQRFLGGSSGCPSSPRAAAAAFVAPVAVPVAPASASVESGLAFERGLASSCNWSFGNDVAGMTEAKPQTRRHRARRR